MNDKSKSEIRREDIQAKPTHRYYCDACSGNAGVSNLPEAVKQIRCASCGKVQNCKKENWIAL